MEILGRRTLLSVPKELQALSRTQRPMGALLAGGLCLLCMTRCLACRLRRMRLGVQLARRSSIARFWRIWRGRSGKGIGVWCCGWDSLCC